MGLTMFSSSDSVISIEGFALLFLAQGDWEVLLQFQENLWDPIQRFHPEEEA